jgi:hypothetical protein
MSGYVPLPTEVVHLSDEIHTSQDAHSQFVIQLRKFTVWEDFCCPDARRKRPHEFIEAFRVLEQELSANLSFVGSEGDQQANDANHDRK